MNRFFALREKTRRKYWNEVNIFPFPHWEAMSQSIRTPFIHIFVLVQDTTASAFFGYDSFVYPPNIVQRHCTYSTQCDVKVDSQRVTNTPMEFVPTSHLANGDGTTNGTNWLHVWSTYIYMYFCLCVAWMLMLRDYHRLFIGVQCLYVLQHTHIQCQRNIAQSHSNTSMEIIVVYNNEYDRFAVLHSE